MATLLIVPVPIGVVWSCLGRLLTLQRSLGNTIARHVVGLPDILGNAHLSDTVASPLLRNACRSPLRKSPARSEAHLRARLLHRTTRRIALTQAGERYMRRCEEILAFVDQAEAEAAHAYMRPSGRLRVHATTGFGQTYVVPAVVRYRQRYPSIDVELTLSQRAPDLLEEGYDVLVQLAAKKLPDSGLVCQQLGNLNSILCASPAYLQKNRVPRDVAGLGDHTCLQMVAYVFPSDQWHFEGRGKTETFRLPASGFQVNVADALGVALREKPA